MSSKASFKVIEPKKAIPGHISILLQLDESSFTTINATRRLMRGDDVSWPWLTGRLKVKAQPRSIDLVSHVPKHQSSFRHACVYRATIALPRNCTYFSISDRQLKTLTISRKPEAWSVVIMVGAVALDRLRDGISMPIEQITSSFASSSPLLPSSNSLPIPVKHLSW